MTVRAAEYGAGRARGLFGFIRYIESIEDKKLPVPQAKLVTEGEDVVRVMTIHKSKGLEYPLVVVAGLGKKLMAAGRGGRLALHREFGLALTRENPDTHSWRNTLHMSAVNGRVLEERRAELLRVLYVAMTRAQDRLVLIGSLKGAAKMAEHSLTGTGAKSADTFTEMLLPLAREAGMKSTVVTPSDLARVVVECACERERVTAKLAEMSGGAEEGVASRDGEDAIRAEIDRRLSFVYPHESAARLKSKYGVSELNRRAKRARARFYVEASEEAAAEDEGRAAIAEDEGGAISYEDVAGGGTVATARAGDATERSMNAAERGVVLHKALEKLDYAEARAHRSDADGGASWFGGYLDGLVSAGFLTPECRAFADADALTRFADSELCARATASPRARRETPFNYRMMMDGERVVVQGVIDLFFEEGNDLVLADFKSGGAHADADERARRARETYGEQMRLYREALEAITGKRVKESLLYLTSYGQTVVVPRSADG
jgi:ATP-dependent helicase/nuclease subunit A